MQSNQLTTIIENTDLLHNQSFINGLWYARSSNKEHITVFNPANGHNIANIESLASTDIEYAIDCADEALKVWRHTAPKERGKILRQWFVLIENNKNDLAKIISIEQGKPLKESLAEVSYGSSFVEWFAEEAKRIHGDIYPSNLADIKYLGIKEPLGVVAAITPWNFPCAMVTRKVAPALVAGCTVILKPSEETPLTALALAALAKEAGFPAGIFNVVIGPPQMIGEILCKSNKVKKLSFTGSTKTGSLLYSQCASSIKKLALELGGNAPFVVLEDANLEKAAKDLVQGKGRNTGQSCTNINRVLVNQNIYDKFVSQLVREYSKLTIDIGMADKDQGPLINQAAVKKIDTLITDAINNGARIIYQSKKPQGECFYPLTIIEVPTTKLAIAKDEIFGPVIALYRFKDTSEAITIANDTNYGLVAYLYSQNQKDIWSLSQSLEFGMVAINEVKINNEAIPFGGIKYSGFGYEGSKYGIEEYLHIKYCCLGLS